MTDKTKEALKLALEALEGLEALLLSMGLTHLIVYGDAEKSITALREALAEESSGTEQPAQFDQSAGTQVSKVWWDGDKLMEQPIPLESIYKKPEQPAPKWQGVRFDSALHDQPAQPQQEPVAWMHVMDNTEGLKANGTGIVSITQKRKHPFGKPGVDFSKSYPVTSTPLYTSPPAQRKPWVGLTDEEIIAMRHLRDWTAGWTDITYTRAIEAKLKEKNSD